MTLVVGGSIARCLAVWTVATGGAGALVGLALPEALRAGALVGGSGPASAPFDQLLVCLCSAAVLTTATWLWLVTTAVTIEVLTGARSRVRGVPEVLRRAVLAACGAAVAGGLAVGPPAPALATPGELPLDHGRAPGAVLRGLPLPDRASTATSDGGPSRREPVPPVRPAVVVVRPGDSLWAHAHHDLGPGADDSRIADRVREIHRLNRAVIGPDPDLIRVGQRLRLPYHPRPPGPPERR